jgi:hypothetical protein
MLRQFLHDGCYRTSQSLQQGRNVLLQPSADRE